MGVVVGMAVERLVLVQVRVVISGGGSGFSTLHVSRLLSAATPWRARLAKKRSVQHSSITASTLAGLTREVCIQHLVHRNRLP